MPRPVMARLALVLALLGTALSGGVTDAAPPSSVAQLGATWQQTASMLGQLTTSEQSALSKLFQLNASLSADQAKLAELSAVTTKDEAAVKKSETKLKASLAAYDKAVQGADRLLKLVEYMGPSSYLSVALGSQSFQDFSRRIGAVTVTLDAAHQELQALDKAHTAWIQAEQQAKTAEQTAKGAQQAETAAVAHLQALKQQDASLLAKLGRRRTQVSEHLTALQNSWVKVIRPYLDKVRKAAASLPQVVDNVPGTRVSLGLGGVTIVIPQNGLNQVLHSVPALSGLTFTLDPSGAVLGVPKDHLVMKGDFSVHSGDLLTFHVTSAQFAGIPLDASLVREALGGSGMTMNLSSGLGGASLTSVKLGSASLTMTASLGF